MLYLVDQPPPLGVGGWMWRRKRLFWRFCVKLRLTDSILWQLPKAVLFTGSWTGLSLGKSPPQPAASPPWDTETLQRNDKRHTWHTSLCHGVVGWMQLKSQVSADGLIAEGWPLQPSGSFWPRWPEFWSCVSDYFLSCCWLLRPTARLTDGK